MHRSEYTHMFGGWWGTCTHSYKGHVHDDTDISQNANTRTSAIHTRRTYTRHHIRMPGNKEAFSRLLNQYDEALFVQTRNAPDTQDDTCIYAQITHAVAHNRCIILCTMSYEWHAPLATQRFYHRVVCRHGENIDLLSKVTPALPERVPCQSLQACSASGSTANVHMVNCECRHG